MYLIAYDGVERVDEKNINYIIVFKRHYKLF